MAGGVFNLDLNESFPRLARPPIVEAVIHWQARWQKQYDLETLTSILSERLPQYPIRDPIAQIELMAMISNKDECSPIVRHAKDWQGIRLKSTDGRYVVQFKRDGLVFSRTQGYENWNSFSVHARDAWRVFVEVLEPTAIKRLGVRYINHIGTADATNLGAYLREPPTCPSDLPLKEFVYQSVFSVPGHPFNVRVIKIMQPTMPELQKSSGLFIDVDVYTISPISDPELDQALSQMRCLKNKAFFTLLTEQAIDSFGR